MKPLQDSEKTLHKSTYSPKQAQHRKLIYSKNVIPYQSNVLDNNRAVHYKKGKQLGEGFYVVEISSDAETLFIACYNIEIA